MAESVEVDIKKLWESIQQIATNRLGVDKPVLVKELPMGFEWWHDGKKFIQGQLMPLPELDGFRIFAMFQNELEVRIYCLFEQKADTKPEMPRRFTLPKSSAKPDIFVEWLALECFLLEIATEIVGDDEVDDDEEDDEPEKTPAT